MTSHWRRVRSCSNSSRGASTSKPISTAVQADPLILHRWWANWIASRWIYWLPQCHLVPPFKVAPILCCCRLLPTFNSRKIHRRRQMALGVVVLLILTCLNCRSSQGAKEPRASEDAALHQSAAIAITMTTMPMPKQRNTATSLATRTPTWWWTKWMTTWMMRRWCDSTSTRPSVSTPPRRSVVAVAQHNTTRRRTVEKMRRSLLPWPLRCLFLVIHRLPSISVITRWWWSNRWASHLNKTISWWWKEMVTITCRITTTTSSCTTTRQPRSNHLRRDLRTTLWHHLCRLPLPALLLEYSRYSLFHRNNKYNNNSSSSNSHYRPRHSWRQGLSWHRVKSGSWHSTRSAPNWWVLPSIDQFIVYLVCPLLDRWWCVPLSNLSFSLSHFLWTIIIHEMATMKQRRRRRCLSLNYFAIKTGFVVVIWSRKKGRPQVTSQGSVPLSSCLVVTKQYSAHSSSIN